MTSEVAYSARERGWLWTLAAVGMAGLNGVFLYGLVRQPQALRDAMTNPVSLAFLLEALVLTGVLAYLLPRWGVTRLRPIAFVALSLLGGLAFALPVALLWKRRS
jgi:hypothetical protein